MNASSLFIQSEINSNLIFVVSSLLPIFISSRKHFSFKHFQVLNIYSAFLLSPSAIYDEVTTVFKVAMDYFVSFSIEDTAENTIDIEEDIPAATIDTEILQIFQYYNIL
jgi:hypothetical protein